MVADKCFSIADKCFLSLTNGSYVDESNLYSFALAVVVSALCADEGDLRALVLTMRLPDLRANRGCFRSLRGEAFLPAVFPLANEDHSAFSAEEICKSVSYKARFLSRGSFFIYSIEFSSGAWYNLGGVHRRSSKGADAPIAEAALEASA